MGELSKVEGSAQSHLAFRGLSCWEALVTLYLWFRFLTWSMIAICSRFCSPGGGVMFLWELWVLFSLGWPFQGCWGVYGLWLRLRAGRVRLSFRGLSCWESVIGVFGRLGEGGGELMGCIQSRELGGRASSSQVHPATKLQWHFTCGFSFRHSYDCPL